MTLQAILRTLIGCCLAAFAISAASLFFRRELAFEPNSGTWFWAMPLILSIILALMCLIIYLLVHVLAHAIKQANQWFHDVIKNSTSSRILTTGVEAIDDIAKTWRGNLDTLKERVNDQEKLITKLKHSEERYRRLIEGLKNEYVFYTHDEKGNFTYVSPSISNVLGYTQKEAIEKFSEMLKAGREAPIAEPSMEAEGRPIDALEVQLKHKDGQVRILEIHDYPVLDKFCNVRSVEGIARDITRRKMIEKELLEAQIQAEQANRAKSTFLSNMSHELRTPLNGVLGYVQLLQRDRELNEGQRQRLSGIESCGQHLLHVISEVLDLSKIESGNMELDQKPCDFGLVLSRVGDIIRQRAELKGIAFTIKKHAGLPNVIVTDEVKLKQILINLLGNAVKFTDKGSISLEVQRTSRNTMLFEVNDTGMGIEQDKLGDMFEAFKQAAGGKNFGGTGLGLTITKSMVEMLGGEISATSELGKGTTFYFTLPFHDSVELDINTIEKDALTDTWNPVLCDDVSPYVLVVDDNEISTDILARLLESAGFSVKCIDEMPIVYQYIQNHDIDLVLIDVDFICVDFFEVSERLRSVTQNSAMKIIALSANVLAGFKSKILDAGYDDCVVKPLYVAELFQKIGNLLSLSFVESQSSEKKAAIKERQKNNEDDPRQFNQDVATSLEKLEAALQVGDVGLIEETLAALIESSDVNQIKMIQDLQAAHQNFDFGSMMLVVEKLKTVCLGDCHER